MNPYLMLFLQKLRRKRGEQKSSAAGKHHGSRECPHCHRAILPAADGSYPRYCPHCSKPLPSEAK